MYAGNRRNTFGLFSGDPINDPINDPIKFTVRQKGLLSFLQERPELQYLSEQGITCPESIRCRFGQKTVLLDVAQHLDNTREYDLDS